MSLPEVIPEDPEVGHYFSDTNWALSTNKINTKSITIGDAAYIASIASKKRGQYFRIIGTQRVAGLQPDRTYVVSADGTRLIPEVGIKHLHNLDTDEAGGDYINIWMANAHRIYLLNMMHPTAAMFKTTVSNASTVTTANSGVLLTTDSIPQAFAQVALPGGSVALYKPIKMDLWTYADSGSNVTIKMGINMEDVSAQQTLDARIGLDVCDVSNTPRNWNIVGGTGSSWSQDPTTEPVARDTQRAYQLKLTPLQSITFARLDDNDLESISIKTTSVPGNGSSALGKAFNAGIKANEATAKALKISMIRTIGTLRKSAFPYGETS